MSIRLMLQIDPPDPGPQTPSVEEQIREALDCIESGYRSDRQWLMIRSLYQHLLSCEKRTERMENIIQMITPLMSKYGYHQKPATETGSY